MATSEQNVRQTSLEYIHLGETVDKEGNKVDLLVVAELRKRDNFRMQRSGGQKGRSLRPSPTELKGLYRSGKIDFVDGGEERFRNVMSELNVDLDTDSPTSYRRATRKKAASATGGAVDADSPLSSMTVPKLRDLLRSLGGSPYAGSKPKTKPVLIKEIQELQGDAPATDDKATRQDSEASHVPEVAAVTLEVPSKEPVIEAPIVKEPIVEEPVIEAPVVEEPVIEVPVVEEPVIEVPVVEEPVIEVPVVEEPVIEVPVAEEPVIEVPVAEEPAIDVNGDLDVFPADEGNLDILHGNDPKIKLGEPDFGIEGLDDFDDAISVPEHGIDVDFGIDDLIDEPEMPSMPSEASDMPDEVSYPSMPVKNDEMDMDDDLASDGAWDVPNIGFGQHGILFNTGAFDDDDSTDVSEGIAERLPSDDSIIKFSEDDVAGTPAFDVDEPDTTDQDEDDVDLDDLMADILGMNLDDEGDSESHEQEVAASVSGTPAEETDIEEPAEVDEDVTERQEGNAESFAFSGLPLTIPTKARPHQKRTRVARRHKGNSPQDTSPIASRIVFAQAGIEEDTQGDSGSDSSVTPFGDMAATEDSSGILFAPGVGIDYENDADVSFDLDEPAEIVDEDFDLDEPVQISDDFDLDEPADMADESEAYEPGGWVDADLDEPADGDATFDLDEPAEFSTTFDFGGLSDSPYASNAVDAGFAEPATAHMQEPIDVSEGVVADELVETQDDDRIPLRDDDDEEDDIINIFDDLDQEGINTSERLMGEIYPSYPEPTDATDGHANYSGFQFAWSDSPDDASADDAIATVDENDGFIVLPEVDSPYANGTDESDMGLAEDPSHDAQGEYGSFMATDAYQGEGEQHVTASDMPSATQPEVADPSQDDAQETMTPDGYPLSHGTSRGINEDDRKLVRKTFKRMLLAVLIVALLAVAGIVALVMSGVQVFPMLSF